jgi:hypothetical protein
MRRTLEPDDNHTSLRPAQQINVDTQLMYVLGAVEVSDAASGVASQNSDDDIDPNAALSCNRNHTK